MLQSLGSAHLPKGSDVFLGIDVSITSWHVTVRFLGETAFSASLPPSCEALARVLERLRGCRVHSVYEAGAFGYSLHDWLVEQGVDSIVASPSHIPVEVGNRVKTDRRDSLKLATTLEAGLLRPIFIPPMRQRADRELVRQRDRLQRHRRAAMIARSSSRTPSHARSAPAGPGAAPFSDGSGIFASKTTACSRSSRRREVSSLSSTSAFEISKDACGPWRTRSPMPPRLRS